MSRFNDYIRQIEQIERQGYTINIKNDIYILSENKGSNCSIIDFDNILYQSANLSDIENFINFR